MSQQRGFVMADAIIALTLISVLLVSLLNMTRISAQLAENAETRLTAAIIAQSLIEDKNALTSNGEMDVDAVLYKWTVSVRDLTNNDRPIIKLEQIEVTVSWKSTRGENQFELLTARMRGAS